MWFLSQIGRREHYQLAAHLHGRGMLKVMSTDVWAPVAARLPRKFRPEALAQRYNPLLSSAVVESPSFAGFLLTRFSRAEISERWVADGERFGLFTAKVFGRHGLGPEDTILGFTSANLEPLKLARSRGARALHVQIDPGPEWYAVRALEQSSHPDKEEKSADLCGAYFDRVREEISVASHCLVHSEHTKQSLRRQGIVPGRCEVIPPAYEPSAVGRPRVFPKSRPFRVLFVGNICLMKGFHVFAEAVGLAGAGFEFRAAGSVRMSHDYIRQTAGQVTMLGHLSRRALSEEMLNADALAFPSLSDGFGLVQLEAMDHGLPVIATDCCGAVVRDGQDGFVVPPRDAKALVDRLHAWAAQPDMYAAHSRAALRRVADFSSEQHFRHICAL